MEQKFDIALSAKINEFARKFDLDKTKIEEDYLFENFSNYVIISNELEEELENINKVSTHNAQGIDGIGIIVNDKLIFDESDLEKIGENEKISVKIVFVQSTTRKNFDSSKFSGFVDSVINFLIDQTTIDPFSSIYTKLLGEESDFIYNLKETPKIVLYFASAITEHKIDEKFLDTQREKITNREDLKDKISLESVNFLQKAELKGLYDKIPSYQQVNIKFVGNIHIEEKSKIQMSILSYIKFEELKKLILTKDENLKENLFIENPRSFLNETDVNQSIEETLKNSEYKDYFIYLNNGLTLLCNNIEKHPTLENVFKLTYPRIINGCQTTHVLYNFYKSNSESLQNVELVIKVIATDDNRLKEQIIFAANNQNSITEDLKALNKYHEKIEEYFKGFNGFEIYYERLRGQYPTVAPPYKKVNIENLAKVYISVFLREPHKMKSNAISKIEEYQKKKRIFSPDDNEVNKYYYCALLYYWLSKFSINDEVELRSKTMDMHLLLVCDLQLDRTKEVYNIDDKIKYLCDENNAKAIFSSSVSFLETRDYLFKRRGFYSGPNTKKMIQDFLS
ncbi:MAG: AIPR family protein [Caldisericum sp.]|uniref:AIPR family protein n=1 Tax=Caldisericum sp. TaxID=2499687 RepID=UPI003D0E6356